MSIANMPVVKIDGISGGNYICTYFQFPGPCGLVTLKGNYFRIWYESKEGKSLVVCPSSIVVFPPISFSYHLL